mmetsp:Transcript_6270/g.9629  ORF Transcript_6270/g.9629 Transcript_6270/m.9629 type:complete len:174 (+) Transcript_6270:2978-3499(+)
MVSASILGKAYKGPKIEIKSAQKSVKSAPPQTDVKAWLRQALNQNTAKSYACYWKRFEEYCHTAGKRALPADPWTVVATTYPVQMVKRAVIRNTQPTKSSLPLPTKYFALLLAYSCTARPSEIVNISGRMTKPNRAIRLYYLRLSSRGVIHTSGIGDIPCIVEGRAHPCGQNK